MSESIEEFLRERLTEKIDNKIHQKYQSEWNELQVAAKEFLQKGKVNLRNQQKLTIEEIQSQIKSNRIPEYQLTKKRLQTAQSAKEFYQKLFKFDKILTKYLNELPKRAIFVAIDNEGIPFTYEMSLEDLASLSQKEGRLTVSLPKSNYSSIESQIDKTSTEEIAHINRGSSAVQGIINRLNVFYRKIGNAQKQGGILMWKNNGNWVLAKIPNQGVVSEAYVNFLFTKHKSKQDFLYKVTDVGNKLYYSHSLIGQFYKYLSMVSNMPAIVEEDVLTTFAQYAVKSSKAPLPSIEQYTRTAQLIISSKSKIAPQDLKNMINNTFSKKAQLAPQISSIAKKNIEKELDNAIKETIKEIDI